ncbi:MAG: ribosomal RNA small subunit methyltransferase A [Lentisphaerae bacterium RIFOXYB12_FULL_65_16]|nr:MAG: ribosomal RNA small subunit methyltransferase A [Lentisphaerae bacterium RIFOXYA12_64_32]OGV85535.1 MAG: ribosomal RNA small subunit methyltransferase A [Lentisphaerae bacterium RIFOXYB12_FULL_65_16]
MLLAELELHPRRKWGQNFLTDPNMLDAIVRTAAPATGEVILEIGAGTGVLTERLLAAGARVTAVEIDRRLAGHLRAAFGGHPGLRLIEGDACDLDYDALLGAEPYRVVANLPYACSSVLVATFARLRTPPRDMLLLLQREMADRLAASPGTKDFGSLTVSVRMTYDVTRLRAVPPGVFTPPPEVDSALVRLTARTPPLSVAERDRVGAVARVAFGQRRKKLSNALSAHFDAVAVREAMLRAGIPADVRPEQVDVLGFVRLAACLPAE